MADVVNRSMEETAGSVSRARYSLALWGQSNTIGFS